MANPVLNPTMYARVTGIVLALVALLGIAMSAFNNGAFVEGFLVFDWTHDILHVVLAGAALLAGFAAGGSYSRIYARVFGVVYTGLGIAGLVGWTGFGTTMLHLELGENLVHLLVGVWGLAAGFLGSTTTTSSPGPRNA